MKKFSKLALATLMLSTGLGMAQAHEMNNWSDNSEGLVWMNGTDEHCWKSNYWTAETAGSQKCGKPAPAPVVVAPPAPEPMPAPIPAPVAQITTEKFTFASDAMFDFDKAILKAEGKSNLDKLIADLKDPNMKLEIIVVIGRTDSFGSDSYNNKLSLARAKAVRNYIISGGIDASKVSAEGKGKTQLKVDPKSCPKKRAAHIACEAPNRIVEVEVTGAKTITKMVTPEPVVSAPMPENVPMMDSSNIPMPAVPMNNMPLPAAIPAQ